jgi:pSer/pThr/pTyr-binding forkhead associated (FHA) protein
MNDPNRTQALQSDPNRTQLGAPPVLDPNRTVMGSPTTINATQTIKPVQCPVCKTFNPAGMMFCVECGLIFDRALPDDAFGAPAIQLPVLLDDSGREYPIRPGENIVGREGDIAAVDGRVSRRHAKITLQDGVLSVEDLNSTNGTMVGGDRLNAGQSVVLNQGEKLSFGGFEMTLSMPGHAGATQMLGGNKTAAMQAAPQVEAAPGELVGGDTAYPLKKGTNSFGRKAENDVPITDPYVSGRHGVIELAEDGIYLTDTGSTNGTVLNDAKLTPNMRTKISEEDVIRLGSLEFRVKLRTETEEA